MIYSQSVDELVSARRRLVENYGEDVKNIHKRAEASYYTICILGKLSGMSENHPAVRIAEGIFADAYLKDSPADIANELLRATCKLEEVLFAEVLLK